MVRPPAATYGVVRDRLATRERVIHAWGIETFVSRLKPPGHGCGARGVGVMRAVFVR